MFNIDVDTSLSALMPQTPQMPWPSVSGIMTAPVGNSPDYVLYHPNNAMTDVMRV
jgi:hypothetical protein